MTDKFLEKLFDDAKWSPTYELDAMVKAVEDKYLGAFALSDDDLDVWAAGDPSSYLKDDDDDR